MANAISDNVTVILPVSSVSVTSAGNATTVINGLTLQMSATVLPSDATESTVTWSVTNGTGSATINSSTGLLTATGAGTVTVTATANDGSAVTGTKQITVITTPILPTSLSATAGNAQASLSWTAPADNGGAVITDYSVQYKAHSSGTWLDFSHTPFTNTSATVTGLTNGTQYDFQAAAINSVGAGAYSSTANATPVFPQQNNFDVGAGGAVFPTKLYGSFSLSINNGSLNTSYSIVTLKFSSSISNIVKMAVSNFIDLHDVEQQDFKNLFTYNLCETISCPAGFYTVYAKLYDNNGVPSDVFYSSINLTNESVNVMPTALTPTILYSNVSLGQTFMPENKSQTKILQQMLSNDKSVYPSGKVTGVFGQLTKNAVREFQLKYKIADFSNPGFGKVGPKTLAKINEILGSQLPQTSQLAPQVETLLAQDESLFYKTLKFGQTDPDVKRLQIFLNNYLDTAIAKTVPGSKGNESAYFGQKTKDAVIKFQEKYFSDILARAGVNFGTGNVGKLTLEKINSIIKSGQ